jgi:hypothetical protein
MDKATSARVVEQMSFYKLQERLREEGWYVDWNLPCCTSCAWSAVPYEADLDKVLFNHSQDCEVYIEGDECPACEGEGINEDDDDCPVCFGRGEVDENFDLTQYDTSVSGFICNSPEQQSSSLFCFSGDKKGVKNLKEILPIIEECGCSWYWDKTGKTRIEISW